MSALALNISNLPIRQDLEGRYNLNDLHKASGGEQKHQPSNWIRLQQTTDLVDFLISEESKGIITPILTKQGFGTFVVKELVYSYAMWISAKFHISVIRAYDSLVQPQYGLKSLESPRAKKAIKGGLLLEQQDQINDLIKERLINVPQDRKAAMAVRIYSAINTKFETKGMKNGYKNIVPEHFENVMLMIARLPLEEVQLLSFTQADIDELVEVKAKILMGEVMPKEHETKQAEFQADFNARMFVTFERGIPKSTKLIGNNTCVIDPDKKGDLEILINDYVPIELITNVMQVCNKRVASFIERKTVLKA